MKKLFVFIVLLSQLIVVSAHARVFNFKSESLAVFFEGDYSASTIGNNAISQSSGSSTKFTDRVPYDGAFELGFLFLPTEKMTITMSLQGLQTKKLVNVEGQNASGTKLMGVTSEIFALTPKISMEFVLGTIDTSRSYFFIGAGLADVTMDNTYVFTAAGTTAYSTADYIEKSSARTWMYTAGLGYEYLMVDNVTMNLSVGYRYLPINEFKLKHDTATIYSATAKKSSVLLNDDSNPRKINLSATYIALGFRFYINLM